METLTPACSSPLSKLHRRFVTHDGALPVFMPVSPCRADQTPISTWCFEAGTEQVHSLNFAIHFLMSQWLSTAMSSFAAHRQDYKQKECDMKDQRLEASKSWRDLEQSCRSIVSTVSTKRYADDQATGLSVKSLQDNETLFSGPKKHIEDLWTVINMQKNHISKLERQLLTLGVQPGPGQLSQHTSPASQPSPGGFTACSCACCMQPFPFEGAAQPHFVCCIHPVYVMAHLLCADVIWKKFFKHKYQHS